MDDKTEVSEMRKDLPEPVGDVVIGKTDPRILTQEMFEKSPELLYHGALDEFEFSRNFDFSKESNSWTIGRGFYVTPDKESALQYSQIRKEDMGRSNEPPVVYALLPHEARMYDFRARNNTLTNAPVPYDLAREYYRFLRQQVSDMNQSKLLTDHMLRARYTALQIIASNLAAAIRGGENIGLRQMMNGESEESTIDRGATELTDLMLRKGYDGLIYNEGGDRPDQKHTTSYVFYNLQKIGTYNAWHSQAV